MEIVVDGCVRGFHVYQEIWTPVIGECLHCKRERDNAEDRHAVAVCKSVDVVVGHVPRSISCLCSAFIRRGGTIDCTIEGTRRYSSDLPQGGMEIPCKYIFKGMMKELQKVTKYYKSALGITVCVRNTDENSAAAQSESKSASNALASTSMTVTAPTALVPPVKRLLDSSTQCTSGKRVNCINIPVDDTPLKVNTTNSEKVWVQFQRSVLTVKDKQIIEEGHRLTDKHINFAQRLISSQFPHIGGLQSTLLQDRYYCFPHQSIQAVFCKKREHWIVASNMLTTDSHTVNVYDSMFDELDQEASTLIQQIFYSNSYCNNSGIKINMRSLQKQDGYADCGVFAVAVLTSLAYKEEPSSILYDQTKLREHLVQCFTAKLITLFPR